MNWMRGDVVYTALKVVLDACLIRHRVISNNIANVDTPGFKRSKVIFEEKLRDLIKERNISPHRIRKLRPEIVIDQSSAWREDFNNVDIEREMMELSKNTLKYKIYVQFLSRKLGKIRQAIMGR